MDSLEVPEDFSAYIKAEIPQLNYKEMQIKEHSSTS